MLTQFGFVHGWRMAEAMQAQFEWDSSDDWRRAGTRIHALEGLFRVEPESHGPPSKDRKLKSYGLIPDQRAGPTTAPTRS